mmetsp:Transcript_33856/g.108212  ORF Transcript_33856/g.108212 Transcript_33856/m.108212 type:complete len:147 (-) Transcript_33856:228-668(-)
MAKIVRYNERASAMAKLDRRETKKKAKEQTQRWRGDRRRRKSGSKMLRWAKAKEEQGEVAGESSGADERAEAASGPRAAAPRGPLAAQGGRGIKSGCGWRSDVAAAKARRPTQQPPSTYVKGQRGSIGGEDYQRHDAPKEPPPKPM